MLDLHRLCGTPTFSPTTGREHQEERNLMEDGWAVEAVHVTT